MPTDCSIAKNYWFWVFMILVIGAFFFYVAFDSPTFHYGGSARLTMKFGQAKIRAFEGPVDEGMTILRALISSSYGGNFNFRYSLDKDGNVNLASIDGAINGPKSWHFFLNNEPIDVKELSKIRIKSKDLIEARYE